MKISDLVQAVQLTNGNVSADQAQSAVNLVLGAMQRIAAPGEETVIAGGGNFPPTLRVTLSNTEPHEGNLQYEAPVSFQGGKAANRLSNLTGFSRGKAEKFPIAGGPTLSRGVLAEYLGSFGANLFDYLDESNRDGESVSVLSVREARQAFSNVRQRGHGAIVRPQRTAAGDEPAEEFLVISLSDMAEAYRAAEAEIDWVDVFSPRPGLPAAEEPIALRRGAPGRRLQL